MPASSVLPATTAPFHGPAIVRAAFIIAMFGWGFGFYGPPVFLHAVMARTGWSLSLVSTAVTLHFLLGACVVVLQPRIHRRIGLAAATSGGAIVLATGAMGWAMAHEPWQLFAAAALTGAGWVMLGAAALNAIVSPWFSTGRPRALATAYNGASLGGVVFTPLWVMLIERLGFPLASAAAGLVMLAVVLPVAVRVLSITPASVGQVPDGVPALHAVRPAQQAPHASMPMAPAALWRDRGFVTLAGAMALGLFAQIGLIAQLYSLLVPVMGAQPAGWTMTMATACSMAGRTVMARLLGPQSDRRFAAGASYALQAAGTVLLIFAGPGQWPLIVLAVALFGLGIGNATSLPPLIAQVEFARDDVPRVVARTVAVAQGFYAFAPAAFAAVLVAGTASSRPGIGTGTVTFFVAVLVTQLSAIALMLAGRRA